MALEQLGLIGNCQFAALINTHGAIVWCCLPRFDSDPIFGSLLDPDGGSFIVGPADDSEGAQRYLDNTNVLETVFDAPGGRFRVVDFAPRFEQFGRVFRPTQIFRLIEPLSGAPRIKIRCAPVRGWTKEAPAVSHGSHHLAFSGYGAPLRLTTDIPITYMDGLPFTLIEKHWIALTWGTPIEEPLASMADRFLTETVAHWQAWVKNCDIPPTDQLSVIRSALALKLHCFEDTGAIVASVTTSIPEFAGSGRTWDYRYCWLRDAYYVVDAFRLLGQFAEREAFVRYVLNVAGGNPTIELAPLYSVAGTHDELTERSPEAWAGFEGNGPVRVGNAAAFHRQHDIFGELVLTLAPIFFDERFRAERSRSSLDLVMRLAERAIAVAGTPDTGIWEFRTAPTAQTFSSVMCWAAADRAAAIAKKYMPDRADRLRDEASRIHAEIMSRAWSETRGSFVGAYDGSNLDAALLQMVPLRFLPTDDPRLAQTIDAIQAGLSRNGWLMRYREDDGLGEPQVAFVLCMCWLAEALATIGRTAEARKLIAHIHAVKSPLGLLSEDYDAVAGRMWGNFPQAYSHVGLIRAAFAAAPRWADLL